MHIDKADTSKLLRGCLKAAFPHTKFSIRQERGNFTVEWNDGPTGKQVRPLLQRFESKHFDAMTDMESPCGARVLVGVQCWLSGGYISARRNVSPELTVKVTRKLAAECGIDAVAVTSQTHVPFQWHDHWHKNDRNEDTPVTPGGDRG